MLMTMNSGGPGAMRLTHNQTAQLLLDSANGLGDLDNYLITHFPPTEKSQIDLVYNTRFPLTHIVNGVITKTNDYYVNVLANFLTAGAMAVCNSDCVLLASFLRSESMAANPAPCSDQCGLLAAGELLPRQLRRVRSDFKPAKRQSCDERKHGHTRGSCDQKLL